MKITLYVLRGTETDKRYVGITNNLERRLAEHRRGSTKGGQIIGDLAVIHTEHFDSYAAARCREKFLKSGKGREWLNQNFPARASAPQAYSNPP